MFSCNSIENSLKSVGLARWIEAVRIFSSVLFVPGDDGKKAGNAFAAGADAVV